MAYDDVRFICGQLERKASVCRIILAIRIATRALDAETLICPSSDLLREQQSPSIVASFEQDYRLS